MGEGGEEPFTTNLFLQTRLWGSWACIRDKRWEMQGCRAAMACAGLCRAVASCWAVTWFWCWAKLIAACCQQGAAAAPSSAPSTGWFLSLPWCQRRCLSHPSEPAVGANPAQKHSLLLRPFLVIVSGAHGAHPLSSTWVLCQLSLGLNCSTALHNFVFSCRCLSSLSLHIYSICFSCCCVNDVLLIALNIWNTLPGAIAVSFKYLKIFYYHDTYYKLPADNAQFSCL